MKYPLTKESADVLMREALVEAKRALEDGEVPVGAVVSHEGQIIARSHNLVESRIDPTAHAEILALQQAARFLGSWRLSECVLCVTIEPCTMCAGALLSARIPIVIFGAYESKTGALGSIRHVGLAEGSPRIVSNVLADECKHLIQSFFEIQRNSKISEITSTSFVSS
jgi:tRNA(adenine34) deaminase